MRSIWTVLLILPALSLTAHGQTTYPFLRGDIAPRVAALGGAFASMTGDPNSLFINPAALSTVRDASASASYLDHLLDISAGSLVIVTPDGPVGPLAAGVVFYHYGTFDRTDPSANVEGTFSAADIAVSVGTSLPVAENLTAGAAVKFIHSSIADYRSQGLAVDAGVLYLIPEERIALSAGVLHAGAQLRAYNGTRERLPTDLRIGITKRPEHLPVYLNLNFTGLSDSHRALSERIKQWAFGAEFDMSSSLRVRVGYNNRIRREMKLGTSAGLAGFSLGAGVSIGGYLVDYAFNSYGAVGGLHRFGISAAL